MNYALIVVYNKLINESKTFNSLIKYKDMIKLIIFDNSNEKIRYDNRKYCDINKIQYYTLNENVGLSRAYNFVIDRINNNDKGYLMIFDDDTELSIDYIKEATKLMRNKKYDVILPIVKCNNHIISPSNLKFDIKYVEVKKADNLKTPNIDAINSGMIVKLSIYNKIRYDEHLFLDDVDHAFMYFIRKYKYKIFVMDSFIYQNFSRNEKHNSNNERTRFKIWIKDHKYYCLSRNKKLFYYLSTLKHRIRQFIKCNFDTFYLFYK